DGDSGAPMESMRGLRREGGTGGDAELEPGQERRSNAGRQQEAVQKRDPGKEQRRESPQSGAKDLGKGLLEQDHRPAVTEQRSEQRRKPVGVTEGDRGEASHVRAEGERIQDCASVGEELGRREGHSPRRSGRAGGGANENGFPGEGDSPSRPRAIEM